MAEKSFPCAVRFDANPPSLQEMSVQNVIAGGNLAHVAYTLHNLPIYLADWIFDYLANRRI